MGFPLVAAAILALFVYGTPIKPVNVAGMGLIARINVPKTLFPMAVIQEGLYKQAAVFALLIAVLIANGYMPSATWLYLLPIVFVNYLMIVACAFIGACLVCMVRDFSMVISWPSIPAWHVRPGGSIPSTWWW